jgi:hypothetical protein
VATRVVPVWHMFNEFLEDLFELDLRVLHTLPRFFFLPGRLTKEYVQGRRRRYVRPLRLYLFSSFLLFTVLALTNAAGFGVLVDVPSTEEIQRQIEEGMSGAAQGAAAIEAARSGLAFAPSGTFAPRPEGTSSAEGGAPADTAAAVDPVVEAALARAYAEVAGNPRIPEGLKASLRQFGGGSAPARSGSARAAEPRADTAVGLSAPPLVAALEPAPPASSPAPTVDPPDESSRMKVARFIAESESINFDLGFGDTARGERIEQMLRWKVARAIATPGDLVSGMIDKAPYLMFLMLPTFALLLKLLYVRRGRLYVEHLIFALHIHALAFFTFTAAALMGQSSVAEVATLGNWIAVSPFVYLILALRHVYGQSLAKTVLKAVLLLGAYEVALAIAFVVLAVGTVILM